MKSHRSRSRFSRVSKSFVSVTGRSRRKRSKLTLSELESQNEERVKWEIPDYMLAIYQPLSEICMQRFGEETVLIAWDPDGRSFATYGTDNAVRVHQRDGQIYSRFVTSRPVVGLHWEHTGAYLAAHLERCPSVLIWVREARLAVPLHVCAREGETYVMK
eukprot:61653_1